jgi:hypothetical protein
LLFSSRATRKTVTSIQKKRRQKLLTIYEAEEIEEQSNLDSTLSQGIQADAVKPSQDLCLDSASLTQTKTGNYLPFLSVRDEQMLKAVSQKHRKIFQEEFRDQKTVRGTIETHVENRQNAPTHTRSSGGDSEIGPESPHFWAIPISSSENIKGAPHVQTNDDFSAALHALFVM